MQFDTKNRTSCKSYLQTFQEIKVSLEVKKPHSLIYMYIDRYRVYKRVRYICSGICRKNWYNTSWKGVKEKIVKKFIKLVFKKTCCSQISIIIYVNRSAAWRRYVHHVSSIQIWNYWFMLDSRKINTSNYI